MVLKKKFEFANKEDYANQIAKVLDDLDSEANGSNVYYHVASWRDYVIAKPDYAYSDAGTTPTPGTGMVIALAYPTC